MDDHDSWSAWQVMFLTMTMLPMLHDCVTFVILNIRKEIRIKAYYSSMWVFGADRFQDDF